MADPVGVITEYPIPTQVSGPIEIASASPGPGGLWFTESNANKVAKMTTSGAFTEYPIPTANSFPIGITMGPDGNLWVTESNANKVAKVTPNGMFTEYPVPTPNGSPNGIVTGPDGNLWFTEYNGQVAKVTTGGVFTEYPVPTPDSQLQGITVGPDGNLWFAEQNGNKVAKVTTTGSITEYPVPTAKSGPNIIVAGPDGNLWFTETSASRVAKVTTNGVFTEYPVPTADSQPSGIAVGPDGNLWFTEIMGNKVAKVTTSGVFAEYPVPTSDSRPVEIVAGPDGNVWFTEFSGNKVAKVGTGVSTSRIYGVDAVETGISVSQQAFPAAGSAGAVVLARSDFFSDALAGGPLAAHVGGPLLITPGASLASSLDPRVVAEIQRVLPAGATVYLLGGQFALASGIDAQLTGLGYHPVRVAGDTLYGTAVAIADRLGNPATVFEATGTNFPDALSAVPAAIKNGGVILLTNGPTQAPETQAYLDAHPGDRRFAIGGPFAAAGADPTATAVWGQDLYETAAAVAGRFFAHAGDFGAATGLNYPDALTGGVFMATGGRMGPMLLVNSTTPLPASIAGYLGTLMPGTPGYVFGGPLAVDDDVLHAIQTATG